MTGAAQTDPAAPPLTLTVSEDPTVRVAFTGRGDGNLSHVVGSGDPAAARRRLLGLVGLPPERGVFMQQIHGGRVARAGVAEAGRGLESHEDALPGVDALVTTEDELGLVAMVADCMPVVLVAPGIGVGVVHAGRRGIVAGVVGAATAALADECGTSPRRIVALVGPGIGGCCYEVPPELATEVGRVIPEARTVTDAGTSGLDLPAAVAVQLTAAGVGRIESHGGCTRCHRARWFSHRATTVDGVAAGRQGAVVRRGAAPPREDEHRFID